MHLNLPFKLLLLAFCFLLCACGRPPEGPYAKWLKYDEEVVSAKEEGPFTILRVEYRPGGWGSFHGTGNNFDRILYRGKIVVEQARETDAWKDLVRPAILADVNTVDERGLKIVYEGNGKPIVKRIDAMDNGSSDHVFGEVLGPGLRYFPMLGGHTQGFLLRAFPLQVQILPLGPTSPAIWQLTSLAPDSKAFAYADSLESPSVVVVVDENGKIGEPMPIPVKTVQSRTWFDAYFKWLKNAQGRWEIAKVASSPAPLNTGSALEELFLDADAGYRDCFASISACRGGWRREPLKESDAYDCDCSLPLQYKPPQAVQAFGANVRALWYGRSEYDLVLDAPPNKVGSALRKRLGERRIDFVGPENISRERVEAFLQTDSLRDDWIRVILDNTRSQHFVMPTLTVRVDAFKQGTIIHTIARYPAKH